MDMVRIMNADTVVVITDKYINLFLEELEKVGIPCTVEGPFPKRLPKHAIPRK